MLLSRLSAFWKRVNFSPTLYSRSLCDEIRNRSALPPFCVPYHRSIFGSISVSCLHFSLLSLLEVVTKLFDTRCPSTRPTCTTPSWSTHEQWRNSSLREVTRSTAQLSWLTFGTETTGPFKALMWVIPWKSNLGYHMYFIKYRLRKEVPTYQDWMQVPSNSCNKKKYNQENFLGATNFWSTVNVKWSNSTKE